MYLNTRVLYLVAQYRSTKESSVPGTVRSSIRRGGWTVDSGQWTVDMLLILGTVLAIASRVPVSFVSNAPTKMTSFLWILM